MSSTNKRSWRTLLEMALFPLVLLLSAYLGMLLFSAFEPTLVRGAMRGLRVFLGVSVAMLGVPTFYSFTQRFDDRPHYRWWFSLLTLIIGPLEYFGTAIVLDALFVG